MSHAPKGKNLPLSSANQLLVIHNDNELLDPLFAYQTYAHARVLNLSKIHGNWNNIKDSERHIISNVNKESLPPALREFIKARVPGRLTFDYIANPVKLVETFLARLETLVDGFTVTQRKAFEDFISDHHQTDTEDVVKIPSENILKRFVADNYNVDHAGAFMDEVERLVQLSRKNGLSEVDPKVVWEMCESINKIEGLYTPDELDTALVALKNSEKFKNTSCDDAVFLLEAFGIAENLNYITLNEKGVLRVLARHGITPSNSDHVTPTPPEPFAEPVVEFESVKTNIEERNIGDWSAVETWLSDYFLTHPFPQGKSLNLNFYFDELHKAGFNWLTDTDNDQRRRLGGIIGRLRASSSKVLESFTDMLDATADTAPQPTKRKTVADWEAVRAVVEIYCTPDVPEKVNFKALLEYLERHGHKLEFSSTVSNKLSGMVKALRIRRGLSTECPFSPGSIREAMWNDLLAGHFSKELGVETFLSGFRARHTKYNHQHLHGNFYAVLDVYDHSRPDMASESSLDNSNTVPIDEAPPVLDPVIEKPDSIVLETDSTSEQEHEVVLDNNIEQSVAQEGLASETSNAEDVEPVAAVTPDDEFGAPEDLTSFIILLKHRRITLDLIQQLKSELAEKEADLQKINNQILKQDKLYLELKAMFADTDTIFNQKSVL